MHHFETLSFQFAIYFLGRSFIWKVILVEMPLGKDKPAVLVSWEAKNGCGKRSGTVSHAPIRIHRSGKASKAPLRPITVFPKAFWRINLDLLGPIYPVTEQGNKYILLMIDPSTKYADWQKLQVTYHFFIEGYQQFILTNSIDDLFFLPRDMMILFVLKKI